MTDPASTSADAFAPFPDDWTSALAVVAHPDDLEYGPSCAIAAWTLAGKSVDFVMVTRGEAGIDSMHPDVTRVVRSREEVAAARAVGVERVRFLDGFPDGSIEHGLALRRAISAEIRRTRPDLVITLNFHERWRGGQWNSSDHRATGMAVMDAVADAGNRWIFPELLDEGLEPWKHTRWVAVGGSPFSTHAVDVRHTIEMGVSALAHHRTYLDHLGPCDPMADARRVIEDKAARFATRFGGVPAMAFEVIGV